MVEVSGPDGTYRRTIDALGCIDANSIAVDAAGRVYAGLGNRIAIFDRYGALLARFGEAGTGVGQFDGTRLSVLGNVLTSEDPVRDRVQPVDLARGKPVEGCVITPTGPRDES